MKPSVRAWPFESKYLRDFAVVEERHNGLRLFPATEQLPLLSQAITREFEYGLTSRLAHTDSRADNWRKLQLRELAFAFTTIINAARPDHLHVQPYFTPDFVTQIAIVQHITESCPEGLAHRFRFFRGQDFLPDVYLAGKRLGFASHAIDRYAERAVCTSGHPLTMFIRHFFASAKLPVLLSENRPALALPIGGSMIAMPYKETADEYFVLTTLAPAQISILNLPDPLPPMHLHYGPKYQPPVKCYDRTKFIELVMKCWRENPPLRDNREHEQALRQKMRWIGLVRQVDRYLRKTGNDEHTCLMFQDGIHSPNLMTFRPFSAPPRPTLPAPAQTTP